MTEVAKFLKEYDGKFKDGLHKTFAALTTNMPNEMEVVLVGDMIRFQLPLKKYSKTYNKQPLMYAALSARKANLTLTLTGIYNDEDLKDAFISAVNAQGLKLKTTTSCLKFKKVEELPLVEIKKLTKRLSTKRFIKNYEELMKRLGK